MQKYKKLIIVLVILIIIIISLATFLFLKNKSKSSTENRNSPVTTDKTTDWATYQDSKYKYSIKYGGALAVKNKSENSIIIDTAETINWMENSKRTELLGPLVPFIQISVYENMAAADSNYATLDDFVQKNKSTIEEKTINGVKGYLYSSGDTQKWIYLQKNNFIYRIDFDMRTDKPTQQQQVIDSIKFN